VNSLLNRVVLQKAVGVYLGEQEIFVCLAGISPTGHPMQINTRSLPYSTSNLANALQEAMKPFLRKKRRQLPTAVGLPASKLFFGARPIEGSGSNVETSSEALLQKALCSPNIRVDDYIIDLMKTEVGKHSVAGIAACRKKYMAAVMSALGQCGIRPIRTEPGPCAMLRAAIHCYPTPRKVKSALRILCNDNQAIAILTLSNQPLAWRALELPHGREIASIISAVRTMQSFTTKYGMDGSVEALIVHQRKDLHENMMDPRVADAVGMRVFCCKEPAMGPESIAFGLALGAFDPELRAFDFSVSLKPRISFREIFPWWDLILEGSLLASLGFLLWVHGANIERQYQAVQQECDRHECLKNSSTPALEKEKKEIRLKLDMVRHFLETRILCTSYLHHLPSRLPPTVCLQGLMGQCTFGSGTSAEIKKTLMLRAVAEMTPDGALPRDIDVFLKSLRSDPMLLQNFSRVEMTDIKQSQAGLQAQVVNFTVLCQSQPGKSGAPAIAVKNKDGKSPEVKAKGGKSDNRKTKLDKTKNRKVDAPAQGPPKNKPGQPVKKDADRRQTAPGKAKP
jgi:hypothetical protein